MAVTITMPQLGETVTEGTILSWAKQVGDTIAEDEVLVEISTDKVDTEMPSPAVKARPMSIPPSFTGKISLSTASLRSSDLRAISPFTHRSPPSTSAQ